MDQEKEMEALKHKKRQKVWPKGNNALLVTLDPTNFFSPYVNVNLHIFGVN